MLLRLTRQMLAAAKAYFKPQLPALRQWRDIEHAFFRQLHFNARK